MEVSRRLVVLVALAAMVALMLALGSAAWAQTECPP
jgi:p-aminobenzoyl-glutamate transporter AbgT